MCQTYQIITQYIVKIYSFLLQDFTHGHNPVATAIAIAHNNDHRHHWYTMHNDTGICHNLKFQLIHSYQHWGIGRACMLQLILYLFLVIPLCVTHNYPFLQPIDTLQTATSTVYLQAVYNLRLPSPPFEAIQHTAG